jgi:chemotaxis signal transduction protein
MTTALVRYRRTPIQEPTLRLICFSLRQAHFCLPLAVAHRVVFRSGAEAALNPGFIQLQGAPVSVVDIAPWLYDEAPLLPSQVPYPLTPAALAKPDQTILVIESPRLGRVGILVDVTPALKRARQSAFSPVPIAYLITHRLRGINTLVSLGGSEPPLFLLDVDQLLLSGPSL